MLVIYHAGCWDGFCAAWLLSKAYPKAEFRAAHYGTEPPPEAEDKTRKLFIVDFSYPRNVMFRIGAMRKRETQMTVLDHHKTAEAALVGLDEELATNNVGGCEAIFDMNKSGGRLTWEYLFERGLFPDTWLSTVRPLSADTAAPWIVDYTEDRDLWRHALPATREINAALRSHELSFDLWDILHKNGTDPLIQEGDAILRREQQIIDSHILHAREMEIDGYKVLVVNATVLFSDIAGRLAEGRPFGACYFDRSDGKRQWSLRSRDGGIDVSEIAKKHGGGGHRNAAGFEENL